MDPVAAWAASGAMALTGRADGPPLGPPGPLVPRLHAIAQRVGARSGEIGRAVRLDELALLGERAAIAGFSRRGTVSCGGACRLLRAADDWIAVSLPRRSDVELLPAWLGVDGRDDPWPAVAAAIAERTAAGLESSGALLGLAVATLPSEIPGTAGGCVRTRLGNAPPTRSLDGVVVVDLSSLWAGPLCGAILAAAGATVVKVETSTRPDGARFGPSRFFELLNGAKDHRSIAVACLPDVVATADVVIEASRPRALEQLGVDAAGLVAVGRPRVWVSITGHGREGPGRNRIGFGDDAAVAGGLVVWEDGEPRFCADAVADPATGLAAAAACLDALANGGRWLLDVALSRVAASLAGPTLPVPPAVVAAPPRARR